MSLGYIHVRGYDAKTKRFEIFKTSHPLHTETFYCVVINQKFVNIRGKVFKVHCDDITRDFFVRSYGVDRDEASKLVSTFQTGCFAMYQLESGAMRYFLQSEHKALLHKYVAFLALDGVTVMTKTKETTLKDARGEGQVKRDKTCQVVDKFDPTAHLIR